MLHLGKISSGSDTQIEPAYHKNTQIKFDFLLSSAGVIIKGEKRELEHIKDCFCISYFVSQITQVSSVFL